MSDPLASTSPRSRGFASRLLAPFGEVRDAEAPATLLLTLGVFVLLSDYYLLKVTREPLILMSGGAAVKTYASAGQALLLVLVSRLYSWLSARFDRLRLTAAIYGGFVLIIAGFALLTKLGAPVGVPFYLFVGVFSLTVISQFWSLANDLFDKEQGARLFAIIGVGSSVGAVFGAWVAGKAYAALGAPGLLLLAALVLPVVVGIVTLAERRRRGAGVAARPEPPRERVRFDRYLWLVALLMLILNWVNTTGEFVLDRVLVQTAQLDPRGPELAIAEFKGSYFSWFNGVGVALQLFVASRLLQRVGVRRVLFVLPVIALLGWSMILMFPVLAVIRAAKIAENSVDYSIQSTANQSLFLVATRREKFAAKNLIDGFFVRFGDVCAAVVIAVGQWLEFSERAYVGVALCLVVTWLTLVSLLARAHERREARQGAQPAEGSGAAGAPA
jgi:ATP:ADP antiporter, AAA family